MPAPTTALASQLQALAGTRNVLKSTTWRGGSLLFEGAQAYEMDRETLHALAVSGLDDLVAREPRFEAFRPTLFAAMLTRYDRRVHSVAENAQLDRSITAFLRLLSPHVLQQSALKVLEWLLRQFSINEFNVNAVMECVLPYHETMTFIMVIRLLAVPQDDPLWHWLDGVRRASMPLSRDLLVKRIHSEPALLQFIQTVLDRSVSAGIRHKTLWSWYLAVHAQYLSTAPAAAGGITDAMLRAVAPPILALCTFHQSADLQSIAFLLMALIARRTVHLAPAVVEGFLLAIAENVPKASETDVDAEVVAARVDAAFDTAAVVYNTEAGRAGDVPLLATLATLLDRMDAEAVSAQIARLLNSGAHAQPLAHGLLLAAAVTLRQTADAAPARACTALLIQGLVPSGPDAVAVTDGMVGMVAQILIRMGPAKAFDIVAAAQYRHAPLLATLFEALSAEEAAEPASAAAATLRAWTEAFSTRGARHAGLMTLIDPQLGESGLAAVHRSDPASRRLGFRRIQTAVAAVLAVVPVQADAEADAGADTDETEAAPAGETGVRATIAPFVDSAVATFFQTLDTDATYTADDVAIAADMLAAPTAEGATAASVAELLLPSDLTPALFYTYLVAHFPEALEAQPAMADAVGRYATALMTAVVRFVDARGADADADADVNTETSVLRSLFTLWLLRRGAMTAVSSVDPELQLTALAQLQSSAAAMAPLAPLAACLKSMSTAARKHASDAAARQAALFQAVAAHAAAFKTSCEALVASRPHPAARQYALDLTAFLTMAVCRPVKTKTAQSQRAAMLVALSTALPVDIYAEASDEAVWCEQLSAHPAPALDASWDALPMLVAAGSAPPAARRRLWCALAALSLDLALPMASAPDVSLAELAPVVQRAIAFDHPWAARVLAGVFRGQPTMALLGFLLAAARRAHAAGAPNATGHLHPVATQRVTRTLECLQVVLTAALEDAAAPAAWHIDDLAAGAILAATFLDCPHPTVRIAAVQVVKTIHHAATAARTAGKAAAKAAHREASPAPRMITDYIPESEPVLHHATVNAVVANILRQQATIANDATALAGIVIEPLMAAGADGRFKATLWLQDLLALAYGVPTAVIATADNDAAAPVLASLFRAALLRLVAAVRTPDGAFAALCPYLPLWVATDAPARDAAVVHHILTQIMTRGWTNQILVHSKAFRRVLLDFVADLLVMVPAAVSAADVALAAWVLEELVADLRALAPSPEEADEDAAARAAQAGRVADLWGDKIVPLLVRAAVSAPSRDMAAVAHRAVLRATDTDHVPFAWYDAGAAKDLFVRLVKKEIQANPQRAAKAAAAAAAAVTDEHETTTSVSRKRRAHAEADDADDDADETSAKKAPVPSADDAAAVVAEATRARQQMALFLALLPRIPFTGHVMALLSQLGHRVSKLVNMHPRFDVATAERVQALLLACHALLAQVPRLEDADPADEVAVAAAALDADALAKWPVPAVVQVLRLSDHPPLMKTVLLLVARIATRLPQQVLQSILPIFTFLGTNLLRQDDWYSFHVIHEVFQNVLPPLTRCYVADLAQRGPADIMAADPDVAPPAAAVSLYSIHRMFADAALHIPKHRRPAVFREFIDALPDYAEWLVVCFANAGISAEAAATAGSVEAPKAVAAAAGAEAAAAPSDGTAVARSGRRAPAIKRKPSASAAAAAAPLFELAIMVVQQLPLHAQTDLLQRLMTMLRELPWTWPAADGTTGSAAWRWLLAGTRAYEDASCLLLLKNRLMTIMAVVLSSKPFLANVAEAEADASARDGFTADLAVVIQAALALQAHLFDQQATPSATRAVSTSVLDDLQRRLTATLTHLFSFLSTDSFLTILADFFVQDEWSAGARGVRRRALALLRQRAQAAIDRTGPAALLTTADQNALTQIALKHILPLVQRGAHVPAAGETPATAHATREASAVETPRELATAALLTLRTIAQACFSVQPTRYMQLAVPPIMLALERSAPNPAAGAMSDDLAWPTTLMVVVGEWVTLAGERMIPFIPRMIHVALRTTVACYAALRATGSDSLTPVRRASVTGLASAALAVLVVMVQQFASFLTPHVPKLLSVAFVSETASSAAPSAGGLPRAASALATALATHAAAALLPAATAFLPTLLARAATAPALLTPFFAMMAQFADTMPAEMLVGGAAKPGQSSPVRDLLLFYVRAFHARTQLTLAGVPADAVDTAEHAVLDAFAHLVLKLSDPVFRPLFVKVVDWAMSPLLADVTAPMTTGPAGGALKVQPLRQTTLWRLVGLLSDRMTSIFTPYFGYLFEPLCTQLQAALDGGLHAAADATAPVCAEPRTAAALEALVGLLRHDQVGFVTPERMDALLPLLVSLTSLTVRSAEDPDADSDMEDATSPATTTASPMPMAPAVLAATQRVHTLATDALLDLAACPGADSRWKTLNGLVCGLAAASSSRITAHVKGAAAAATAATGMTTQRLLAIALLSRIVARLGEAWLVQLLPETLPHLSELLEDADESVEHAARALMAQIGDVLQEDIADYL